MTEDQNQILCQMIKSQSNNKDSITQSIDQRNKSLVENYRPILVIFLGMSSDETEIYSQNAAKSAY